MKNLKSGLILSTLFSTVALFGTTAQADNNALQQAYKSSNVKSALIGVCKTETAKGGKLTSAEVSKYCSCAIESDGKLTNDQKWQIQSAINQKKSPSTLAFVQKQNQELQSCFGPQLTGKLKTLTEAAMKAAQAQK
ncbi:hypothetical protein ACFODO_00585 [Acinetobacter sichuanensis]|uniref:Uncharacterized protein n=1 Tax=Acinetobacter sichuanensis TaxID=2136183 RepID=A0A371YU74_9GAMM|nr:MULTISPECIES: hypothetical protein [Acinetobacter]MDM1247050.1 hypothetical protein [Acinetobacter sp. R933-2]MDM1763519.1 hypothetical protein [Acinetobacter sp. 226-1]MDM1766998.1 hypothetical protein [Acinetobacter sp. 226-4]MDQ9019714.1 hypothetical protein [Acinetobacter sichuanensis]RFC85012.1 hypothetical protein C9E89_003660 [Acinetobacter sichuanensis]